ncbi:MAG TPA: BrnA antitoxin family protein [Pyrinomonadaceae bacterium]|nr:BrnA antitoxin family protein [Pyrinomonadaceae bacterium]
MSENNLKNTSQTNWAKLETMTDEEIDTSDIPPLDEKFFANARLRMPRGKIAVTVSVEKDVIDWYQAQGDKSKALMSAALKIYAEAHQEIRR